MENTIYISSEDLTKKVWRYLNLPKLISLLSTRKLFLCRADILQDKFEGTFPRKDLELWKNIFSQHRIEEDPLHLIKRLRKTSYINCWHQNDDESEAMWRLYCGENEGVAIQTSLIALKDSIDNPSFVLGKIRYIDYSVENFDNLDRNFYAINLSNPFLHKRKAFKHEAEIRILKINYSSSLSESNTDVLNGIEVEVDLERLIENIFVSPYAPKWYFDVIKTVIEKFDFKCELNWSSMFEEPIK